MARKPKNPPYQPERRLFNVKMTAAYLSISIATLNKMLASQVIRPVRIGKRVLFDRFDLDNFIDGLKTA